MSGQGHRTETAREAGVRSPPLARLRAALGPNEAPGRRFLSSKHALYSPPRPSALRPGHIMTTLASKAIKLASTKLSPTLFVYEPSASATSSAPVRATDPSLIVLLAWMGAKKAHAEKYVQGFQALVSPFCRPCSPLRRSWTHVVRASFVMWGAKLISCPARSSRTRPSPSSSPTRPPSTCPPPLTAQPSRPRSR